MCDAFGLECTEIGGVLSWVVARSDVFVNTGLAGRETMIGSKRGLLVLEEHMFFSQ